MSADEAIARAWARVPRLDSAQLRLVACATMLLDHAAVALVPEATCTYVVMRAIGRVAFPLFCLGIAEGAEHTRDWSRYAARLLAMAVVSEVPHDLLLRQVPLETSLQNVGWTLLFGLVAIEWCKRCLDRHVGAMAALAAIGGTLLVMVMADLASVEYGDAGVALVVALWLARRHPWVRAVVPTPILATVDGELPGVALSVVPMALYSGRKGTSRWRWASYVFYPAHLLALCALRLLLVG